MERIMVESGEASIECFSHGTGAAILLLPGGGFSVGYLSDLADALATMGFRAIRVNPRGAGASTGPLDGLTLHDYAADVVGVIRSLDVSPAFVLGHAFGNRVARTVAADSPGAVRAVILVAAGGKIAPQPDAQRALTTLFTPSASTAEVLEAMTWMVGSPESAPKVWEGLRDSRAPGAAQAQGLAARDTPLEQWWSPAGDTPYLVIQGSKDQAAPLENGQLLQAELGARVTLVEIPDAGHLQPLEAPEPLVKAIVAFAS